MNHIDIASVVFLKTKYQNCVQSEYIEQLITIAKLPLNNFAT